MIQCAIALTLVVAAAPTQDVLDDFSYQTAAAARAAWKASEKTPDIDVARDGDRRVVTVRAPFAESPTLQRSVIDRLARRNLVAPGRFEIELAVEPPEACGHLTLYFRSGQGWYSASGAVADEGWQTVQFSKADFRAEGTPAGWDKIDGIRIACWRGDSKDAVIRVRRLAACWSDVALVIPNAADFPQDGEIDSALKIAETVGDMLNDVGLAADTVVDSTLPTGGLRQRSVAIIPYHPRMPDAAVQALVKFVEQGGKVFACYGLPDPLARAIGFQRGKYHRPGAGKLAEIRFHAPDIQGLPKSARQASWNVITVQPVAHGARIIGHWLDRDGNPTELPAMWISDRGAYLSHIVIGDDPAAKRQMLAAVLGHLEPAFWEQIVNAETARYQRIGHFQSTKELRASIPSNVSGELAQHLSNGAVVQREAREAVDKGRYAQAVDLLRLAREHFVKAYLMSQESREVEGRAWWNHSGTGPYPGDWDRACRELADAGFNMIVPNMLWAGRAHYPSDVLPRSRTYKQYGDQIEQCLTAAKRHGLEVHVWKVNHNLSGAPGEFVEMLREEGRLQVFVSGDSQPWLCPSHPKNYRLEVDSMIEVARRYDVDGLHFDYIRYPGSHACFCKGCEKRFQTDTGITVANWPDACHRGIYKSEYTQWRCDQISRLVRTVHQEAKQVRPSIKISAAVFGSYPSCRQSVAQDWPEWIKAGWLDFVCPMDYTSNDLAFRRLVENQLKLVAGRIPIYPGIGCTASNSSLSTDRVVGQILHARELGAAGFTIFNLSESTAREILPGLRLGVTAKTANLPHRK